MAILGLKLGEIGVGITIFVRGDWVARTKSMQT